MQAVVWVADWEMQCCGDPFTVGHAVAWNLSPAASGEWLDAVLGEAAAADVTAFYDHHSSDPVPPMTEGVVRWIQAVHCEYRQTGQVLTPVPGTQVLTPRSTADGWEGEDEPVRFVGYLVELEIGP